MVTERIVGDDCPFHTSQIFSFWRRQCTFGVSFRGRKKFSAKDKYVLQKEVELIVIWYIQLIQLRLNAEASSRHLFECGNLWPACWKAWRPLDNVCIVKFTSVGCFHRDSACTPAFTPIAVERKDWAQSRWKSSSCFPAGRDCLCYWECLEISLPFHSDSRSWWHRHYFGSV